MSSGGGAEGEGEGKTLKQTPHRVNAEPGVGLDPTTQHSEILT